MKKNNKTRESLHSTMPRSAPCGFETKNRQASRAFKSKTKTRRDGRRSQLHDT